MTRNTSTIPKEELNKRFLILTEHLISFHTHLEGKFWHSRLGDHIIYPEWVTVGRHTGEPPHHREHVVPVKMLFEKCFSILAKKELGVAKSECLELLKKYYKVIVISKEKAKLLDSKEKNLKIKMPDDWSFESGDALARIEAVYPQLKGIEFF